MGKVGGHRLDRDLSPPSSLHLDAHSKGLKIKYYAWDKIRVNVHLYVLLAIKSASFSVVHFLTEAGMM